MQSDGNNFCRYVVSDSFNKTSRDEDNISDQIYRSKNVCICIMMILILCNLTQKCYNTTEALKNNFMSSFKNAYTLISRLSVFITVYHVRAVQDDIFAENVPIWLHHTVGKRTAKTKCETLNITFRNINTKIIRYNITWINNRI